MNWIKSQGWKNGCHRDPDSRSQGAQRALHGKGRGLQLWVVVLSSLGDEVTTSACARLGIPLCNSLGFAGLRQKGNSAITNTLSFAFSQIMNCHPTDPLEERGHWLNSAEWSLLSKSQPPAEHRWPGITYQIKGKIKQKERKYQRKNIPVSSSFCITTESA